MTQGMQRSDVSLRVEDYSKAIIEWSTLSKLFGFKILVAENSNSIGDLKDSVSALDNPNLVFVQLGEDTKSQFEGNSAGEFQILKEILERGLVSNEIDLIWKVTGRLAVPNFKKICIGENSDFIVNRLYTPTHLIDTRIIAFSPSSFREVFSKNPIFTMGIYSKKDEGTQIYSSLEHFITLEVLHSEIRGLRVKSMRQVPIFVGYSGTSNKVIDGNLSSLKKKLANFIRPVVVRLLTGSTP